MSAIVGSGVAAAAAQAAISAQSQVDMDDSLVDSLTTGTKEEGSSCSLTPYEFDMFFDNFSCIDVALLLNILFACHCKL